MMLQFNMSSKTGNHSSLRQSSNNYVRYVRQENTKQTAKQCQINYHTQKRPCAQCLMWAVEITKVLLDFFKMFEISHSEDMIIYSPKHTIFPSEFIHWEYDLLVNKSH